MKLLERCVVHAILSQRINDSGHRTRRSIGIAQLVDSHSGSVTRSDKACNQVPNNFTSRVLVLEASLLRTCEVLSSLVFLCFGCACPTIDAESLDWALEWHYGCNCHPLDNQETQQHVLEQQLLFFCCQHVAACMVDFHLPCA